MASTINATTTSGVQVSGDNSGVLQLQTNTGTTAITIDTSQNVGIGTSSPLVQLQVYQASSDAVERLTTGTSNMEFRMVSGGTEGRIATISATPMTFRTSNVEAMRIDSSGNVGIGTSSPSYKTEISVASATNGIGLRVTNSGSTGAGIDFLQSGVDNFSLTMPAGSGGLRFIASGSNERMRIDSSGNVGIGTSSPSKKLDVNGSINANSIEVGLNGESIKKASGSLYIETGSANPLIFTTNSAERMRIDSSGNLLVGTTSATCGGVDMKQHISASDFCFGLTATGGGASRQVARFSYSTTAVGSITVGASSTSYNTSSDYRLKENIQPMTGALAKVAALKPVTYTWKADGSVGQGFIAHELAEIVPQCVTGEKDAVDAEGNPVYQGIDTSFLVATLTAAIQEQQALITQLQEDIATLKGQK